MLRKIRDLGQRRIDVELAELIRYWKLRSDRLKRSRGGLRGRKLLIYEEWNRSLLRLRLRMRRSWKE